MDSAELLDLLGNGNRRRILRLLAHKPCYVTEISEYLGVSPKAVIDHLGKLEEAGLVESRTDERRRKYFSIAQNLRLEVQVSPHEFGAKSAYPASPGFDVSSCRYLSIEVSSMETADPTGDREDGAVDITRQAERLGRLKELENELSLAQRWVQGRLSETRDEIEAGLEGDGDGGRLATAVVGVLASGVTDVGAISREVDAPPHMVEETLRRLADEGVVERRDGTWELHG